ncbi:MAG: hypothetical protein GX456_05065 [Verrucomicrobia bacterium]|nr:hypothetical protein [Verrucomicrobiota bacterium]
MADRASVSIKQILSPNLDWLGAAKNCRAPARGGKINGPGSAAVLGRINPMADRAPVSIKQILGPSLDRLGAAKNRRAPARVEESNGPGSAAVLSRINPTTDLTQITILRIQRPTVDRLAAELCACPHIWLRVGNYVPVLICTVPP